jgi:uncharacterized damage-inducible protein DinB
MQQHFQTFAAYNQWANARLYAAALSLSEDDYRRSTGIFFKSLHGTLNHLLVTDRIWLKRITKQGDHPARLDAILFEDRAELAEARAGEDARLINLIAAYPQDAFTKIISYQNTTGAEFRQPLQDILTHLFNHQTHHRGQAHACLCIITGQEPPVLDMVAFQRSRPGFGTS